MNHFIEHLILARALIEQPETWCKDAFALDPFGHALTPCSPFAVCWCAAGACILAGAPMVMTYGFNDGSSHAQVLEVFDREITRRLSYEN